VIKINGGYIMNITEKETRGDMFADLHIHSQYSDGALTLEEIAAKAKAQNITLISICDHETIEAYSTLDEFCFGGDIRLITGVEIISVVDDVEYHILAYGFDTQNKPLNDLLRYNRSILLDKGTKLIEGIAADCESVSVEEFSKYERDRSNGGWESIDYLKNKGIIKGVPDYFDLVRKYSVPLDRDFLCAAEIIKIIHNAGGYAVLAHLGDTNKQNFAVCEKAAGQFISMGINGFECYYPSHTDEITEFLVNLCREHDLMITAGSDDHGHFSDLNNQGYYIGAVKVKVDQLNLKGLYNF